MTRDYAIRAIAEGGLLRAVVSRTTNLVETARKSHDTLPTATAALGRVLTGAVMMGITLKGEDQLTLRIQGDGPLGQLVAISRPDGLVKGYVTEPHVHLPLNQIGKLDVGAAVGKGMLYVTKDIGLREPYTGGTPLITGEIAEDLTNYFAISEQTPSVVALGVLVGREHEVESAGGFLVQLMPGATEELISQLEENLEKIPPVSGYFAKGKSPKDLLAILLAGLNFEILEEQLLEFVCDCNRKKLEGILLSLGEEELNILAKQEKGAEVRCHYCNGTYQFSENDLLALIKEGRTF